ncbi:uncharacterized protein LOC129238272 [Anastrepha obliqua]|uniref:uncharacterized protein LOC129238272 n=1 Tax=Anastrepha obliqua TaxID=95512 RepID=UPI002408FBFF|nr:uncharacterized protein LOC129238272 [Anastrepha obliqua]
MAFFKVALVLLGLAAVTLQAFGKIRNPHDSENNYQLFHKQRVGRGKRSQDESTGRVLSQDLINRLWSLKGSSSATTAGTTTSTYTTPTTITTSPSTSPTTITTSNTTTARAPQYIIQRFSLNDYAYDDEIGDEEDNSRFALRNGNSYDIYDDIYDDYDNGSELSQDDADDEDNAILVENEQSSFDEVGRAARARPSNWRRRRRQQRPRRRRQQGQRQRRRPNQRRRRVNPKKRVYRRRGPSNRRRRRPSGNNRRGGQRRRIVRIAV